MAFGEALRVADSSIDLHHFDGDVDLSAVDSLLLNDALQLAMLEVELVANLANVLHGRGERAALSEERRKAGHRHAFYTGVSSPPLPGTE